MQLFDQVAMVTGAGSGIGKATALLLAQAGAKIAVVGHTADELEQTAREIREQGGTAMAVVADVADAHAMEDAVQSVIKQWQHLQIVVANAGINGVWSPIEELQIDEWNQTLAVNLTGTFITVKTCVPYLKRQGGSIIVVSSINGTRVFSNTGATAYSTTKAGQVALAKMLAVELGAYRIRVNVICPGAINTSINDNTQRRDLDSVGVKVEYPDGDIPLTGKYPGDADQVAQLALFLASSASSHISGSEIWIDGGQSLVRG